VILPTMSMPESDTREALYEGLSWAVAVCNHLWSDSGVHMVAKITGVGLLL